MVGRSGSSRQRCASATARPRSVPARICGTATVEFRNPACTWPESIAACAGAAPLKGTCVSSIPATWANSAVARWLALPTPAEPMVSPPGRVLGRGDELRHRVRPARRDAPTSTIGWKAQLMMAVKSRTGSKGSRGISGGFITCAVAAISSVWPSGAARATTSVPMALPAPGRFSTTTGWRQVSNSAAASERARMSDGPPRRIGHDDAHGRSGQVLRHWPGRRAAAARRARAAAG